MSFKERFSAEEEQLLLSATPILIVSAMAMVESRLDVATQHVSDSRVAFLDFIGRARVGWMPFAGLRESGLGVAGIPYTFRDMQIEKLMVLNSNELA
jgi:acyl-CoA reductase-like NAD-dependent aldehyde dehydrogenase